MLVTRESLGESWTVACEDNRCKHPSEKAVASRKKAGETDGASVDLSKEDRARGRNGKMPREGRNGGRGRWKIRIREARRDRRTG